MLDVQNTYARMNERTVVNITSARKGVGIVSVGSIEKGVVFLSV